MTAKKVTIYGLLFVGVFACSTSVVFIKASEEHSILLAAYRLLFASIILSPLFFHDLRKHRIRYPFRHFRATIWPGIILGLHFITWFIGLRMTLAANSTLIVTMTPIVMPFFLYFFFRQTLTRWEWAGTMLSVAGMLVLTSGDYQLSSRHVYGDLLSLFSLILLTYYLVLARINRSIVTIWLYIVPLYFFAGVFCLLVSLFFVNPIKSYPGQEIALFLALAIIPTVIGHSLFNYCMQRISSQLVAIATPGQTIFAGMLAYHYFQEVPQWTFYVACIFLLVAIFAALKNQSQEFPSGNIEL